jgi:hypothetical protein
VSFFSFSFYRAAGAASEGLSIEGAKRSFLQIVALIARPYWCKVYNMTIGGISLMSTVSKPSWIDSPMAERLRAAP